MASVKNTQIMPPFVYDFRDWEAFYVEAMAYHAAVSKGRRVSDFIRTFRQFMSSAALEHLDVLVNLHPRFDTVAGWDEWVSAVVSRLHEYDPTVGRFSDIEMHTPNPCMKSCASGAYTEWCEVLQHWSELDKCVADGALTSQEQRRRFWMDATAEQRTLLLEACEFFDPDNALWRYGSSDEQKCAEQTACYAVTSIMSQLTVSRVRQMRFFKRWFYAFVFLSVSSVLMAFASSASNSSCTRLPFVFGALTLALSFLTGKRYFALKRERSVELCLYRNRAVLKC